MKNPLDGLESVSWSALSHAYGASEDVPGHLRMLVTGTAKQTDHAISELFAAILHQGTIYTATIPTVPFFARIAACDKARGRKEALWFLIGFGESIQAGWSKTPKYLPRGTNMKDFDARCREALAKARDAVVKVIGDPSPRLRALAAQVAQVSLPVPAKAVAVLRRQLRVETNNEAKAAIIRALVAADALSESEVDALRKKSSPGVVFATAWKAVQTGARIEPWHFETLSKHWDACAEKLEAKGVCGDAIVELVAARKNEVLPLLDALATRRTKSAQRAAIEGAAALAGMSRSATEAALDVLCRVAKNPAATTRRRLVHALGNMGMGGRVADVVFDLAANDPDPVRPQNFKQMRAGKSVDESHTRDIRADAALALLRAGDVRWERLLLMMREDTDMAGNGQMCAALPLALEREKAPCGAALLGLARKRLADGAYHPGAWCELLATWPVREVSVLSREVIAALPRAVQKASLLLGLWKRAEAVPALNRLAEKLEARGSNEAMWPRIALARLTGDAAHFAKAREAYGRNDKEGRARHFLSDLLEAWAARPDEAFFELCRTLVTGGAGVSYPAREEQLLAIRALAAVDAVEGLWPTLLAIIDKADRPLAHAAGLAVDILENMPARKARNQLEDSLVKLLEAIVTNGRATWSGRDECAPVVAMSALLRLRPGHPKGLPVNLAALKKATREPGLLSLVPDICGQLENIARRDPAHRKKITAGISRLLKKDNRVLTLSNEDCVRLDNAFCRTLEETLGRLAD